MENAKEFEVWLANMLRDAKTKLSMTDKTIAYLLLREGMKYYLLQIIGEEIEFRESKGHDTV